MKYQREEEENLLNDEEDIELILEELVNGINKAEAEYKVVKNSLALIAANEAYNEKLQDLINGPTSILASKSDPLALTKLIYKILSEENKEVSSKVYQSNKKFNR